MIILFLVFSVNAFAGQDCLDVKKCVNTYDLSINAEKDLVKSFCLAQSKEPLMCAQAYNTIDSSCGIKNVVFTQNLKSLGQVVTGVVGNGPQIDRACIDSALKRSMGNGYLCSSEKSKPVEISVGGNDGACISEKLSNFYRQTINDGIDCLNSVDGGVDPKVIVQKMNNESGFNPQLSSPAGIGIGQLVPISIRELLGKAPGEGNGSWIIKKVSDSSSLSCNRFKKIVNRDLKQMPPLPNMTKKNNLCAYISFDGGFQRNVILSLSLYAHYREQIVDELRKKKISINSNGPMISQLTLAAYSRHGPAGVRAYLRSLPNKAEIKEKNIKKRFAYIEEVESKMEELSCIRNFGSNCQSASFRNSKKWTPKDLSGATCVR